MSLNSLSYNTLTQLRAGAQQLISQFDRNNDGRISAGEAQQQVSMGTDSYVSSNYGSRTTVFENKFATLDPQVQNAAHQFDVSADDLVNMYLQRNGNDTSFLAQENMSAQSLMNSLEHTTSVETNRSTDSDYNSYPTTTYVTPYPTTTYVDPSYYNSYNNPYIVTPVIVDPYYNNYSNGPTPPAPDYYRPTPPSVGGYSGGTSVRPVPPSVGGYSGGTSSRPTPPSSGGYSPSSSGSSSRPTPPVPSSGARPPRP